MKKSIFAVVLGSLAVVVVSFYVVKINKKGSQKAVLGSNTQGNTEQAYTISKIASHSTKSDCWLAIEGKVYDVTNFVPKHPGGNRILQGCGKDATSMFSGPLGHIHSSAARALLKNYKIGTLAV